MAMNKAEQAAMEKLKDELRLALALRWCGLPAPSPFTKAELVNGFEGYLNGYEPPHRPGEPAAKWWTGPVNNGPGHLEGPRRHSDGRHASQNFRSIYRTPVDALIAARLRCERECAIALAKIDAQIAQAIAEDEAPADADQG